MTNGGLEGLIIDIRGVEPDIRRSLVFGVIDKLIEIGADRELMIVSDHEQTGLGYQIDLRKETRGRYEFDFRERADGAHVALLRRKRTVGFAG